VRWPDVELSTDPVDVALLEQAIAAGLRFVSTGVITVYKFASSLRYLSYLYPDDLEQRRMLERMRDPVGLAAFVEDVVRGAKRRGGYMHLRYAPEADTKPGTVLKRNEHSRGIAAMPVVALSDRVWLGVGEEARGADWYLAESYGDNPARWRWSGPSIHPRLRLPVTTQGAARIAVHVAAFASDTARDSLAVLVNQKSVPFELIRQPDTDSWVVEFVADLDAVHESVVEFRMDAGSADTNAESPLHDLRPRGFCLLGTGLQPESTTPFEHWTEVDLPVRDFALAGRDAATSALSTVLRSRTWRYSAWFRGVRRRLRGDDARQ
jgi:hypothetical protein